MLGVTVKKGLAHVYDEATQDWQLSRGSAIIYFVLPLVFFILGGIIRLADKEMMRQLTIEDGPFEWGQAIFFMIGVLFSFGAAYQLFRKQYRFAGILYTVLGLGLVFIAGEELAWGQRILEFNTPEELRQINEKEELSVHNISTITYLFTWGKLIVGLYGVLGVFLIHQLRRWWNSELLDLFIVPFFLSSPFLIVLTMRLLRLTFLRHTVPMGYGEFEELFLAYGLASFTAHVWYRLRSQNSLLPV